MKSNIKKTSSFLLMLALIMSLSGCGNNAGKRYQNYVKSIISINYLGATDDYIKATGANKEDAKALYDSNIDVLTDSLLEYYGINLENNPELRELYEELAENIYSKVNYSVSEAYKDGDKYKVDVTIYPINLIKQTKEEIISYVEGFNKRVADGEFNDYTMEEYEAVFSTGMVDILNEGCLNMTYTGPVTITVTIIENGNTYYISDEDFLAIDAAMLAVSTPIADEAATQTDAE